MEERAGIAWPRALDQELEHLIEQAAAGERSEPAAEQDPLTAGREEEAHPKRQHAHGHGRAEEGDRVEDCVASWSGMPMQPVEERHVELGKRVVVDDVLRDPPNSYSPATLMMSPMVRWSPRYSPRANRDHGPAHGAERAL